MERSCSWCNRDIGDGEIRAGTAVEWKDQLWCTACLRDVREMVVSESGRLAAVDLGLPIDEPEPPKAPSRPAPERKCSQCGRAVNDGDLSGGGARQWKGRIWCARCFAALSEKIYRSKSAASTGERSAPREAPARDAKRADAARSPKELSTVAREGAKADAGRTPREQPAAERPEKRAARVEAARGPAVPMGLQILLAGVALGVIVGAIGYRAFFEKPPLPRSGDQGSEVADAAIEQDLASIGPDDFEATITVYRRWAAAHPEGPLAAHVGRLVAAADLLRTHLERRGEESDTLAALRREADFLLQQGHYGFVSQLARTVAPSLVDPAASQWRALGDAAERAAANDADRVLGAAQGLANSGDRATALVQVMEALPRYSGTPALDAALRRARALAAGGSDRPDDSENRLGAGAPEPPPGGWERALAALDYAALGRLPLPDWLTPLVAARLEAVAGLAEALGAGSPPEAAVAPGIPRAAVTGADGSGLALGDRRVPWSQVSPLAAAVLFDWAHLAERSPLGHVLLSWDLGLRRRGDAALLALVAAGTVSREAAQDLLRRTRGEGEWIEEGGLLVPADVARHRAAGEIPWRGEWVGADEAASRAAELDPSPRTMRRLEEQRREEARRRAQERYERTGVYDVTTTIRRGDVAQRIDLVFLSDGYTLEQRADYESLVERITAQILELDPYQNYVHYINVHRVGIADTAPSGSGQTHIGSEVSGDTLSCEASQAIQYARFAPDADLVLVVCNIQDVRATGQPGVICLDASGDIGSTAIHELGHAFGWLEDEYVDPSSAPSFPDWSGPDAEREHVNVTRVSDPGLVKWHYWRLPPAPAQPVDVFEGAYYRDRGYYRPSADCRMRSTGYPDYCPVCLEHLERTFYGFLEPIDQATPERETIGLFANERAEIEGEAVAVLARNIQGGFEARWYLDGEPLSGSRVASRGNRTTATLAGGALGAGWHEVALRVDLSDSRIRRDWGTLSSSRAWRIHAYGTESPRVRMPESAEVAVGDPAELPISVEGDVPEGFRLEPVALPPGARFVADPTRPLAGVLRWTPADLDAGAYEASMRLTDGLAEIRAASAIEVIPGHGRNEAPVLGDHGTVPVGEGEDLALEILAFDADGDHLRFAASGLPLGAVLDPNAGVIRWRPGFQQAADAIPIAVTATDGRATARTTITLSVLDREAQDVRRLTGFDIAYALRSESPQTRAEALGRIARGDWSRSLLVLEATRLVRDHDPSVARAARALVQGLLRDPASGGPDARPMILAEMLPHVRQFTDDPEVLTLLDRLSAAPDHGPMDEPDLARLAREVDWVRSYNRERGAPGN